MNKKLKTMLSIGVAISVLVTTLMFTGIIKADTLGPVGDWHFKTGSKGPPKVTYGVDGSNNKKYYNLKPGYATYVLTGVSANSSSGTIRIGLWMRDSNDNPQKIKEVDVVIGSACPQNVYFGKITQASSRYYLRITSPNELDFIVGAGRLHNH